MNEGRNYPPPRRGILGALDRFIGPGATPAEIWLQFAPALLAGMAAPAYALLRHLGWSGGQLVVAGLLAFDLTGGIVTNATASAKRWYHRQGQGFGRHFAFIASHVIHIFVVAWLFRSLDWAFFTIASAYLVAAAAVILRTPRYLRRPAAFLLYGVALLLSIYILRPTPGLEWFLPFFYLKLLVSHILPGCSGISRQGEGAGKEVT
jgi:hypothetical protein